MNSFLVMFYFEFYLACVSEFHLTVYVHECFICVTYILLVILFGRCMYGERSVSLLLLKTKDFEQLK